MVLLTDSGRRVQASSTEIRRQLDRGRYSPSPTWRKNQKELVHHAPISATKTRAPASGSAQLGKRCMRTTSTFAVNAP